MRPFYHYTAQVGLSLGESAKRLVRWCLTKPLTITTMTIDIDIAPGRGRGKKKKRVNDLHSPQPSWLRRDPKMTL